MLHQLELDEDASIAWLAATVNRKMPAKVVADADISATVRRTLNHRQLQGLRVEGHLMYGVATLVAQKTHLLALQTSRTRRELEREFSTTKPDYLRPEHNSSEPGTPTQTQPEDIISSDFNMERVLDEFRPSQVSQDSDDFADISIDDELRGDADDEMRREDPAPYAPETLSADDQQVLQGILGDAPPPEEPPQPLVLSEIGSDQMDFDEAMTPPSMPDLEEFAGIEEAGEAGEAEEQAAPVEPAAPAKKQPRTRKKRLCPVDDEIAIERSRRVPAATLCDPLQAQVQDEDQEDDFFDPDRISDAIKRRRLVEIPSDVPELEHSEADISVAGISMDGMFDEDTNDLGDSAPMDDDMGADYGAMDDGAPIATEDVVSTLVEQENLEELMAEEIQTARRALKDFGSGTLSSIPTHSQRSRAALFSEALALATIGDIAIVQEAPYEEITLLTL